MKYGGKYWDIRKYPPYQRCFNFINSERSIGKTYTTQGFFLEQAIKKGREFVYIVRTQDEQKKGVFGKAFEKVVRNEFKEYNFEFTKTECSLVIENENGDVVEKTPLGYCIALSEATKNKKINYPNVKWLMFDEYIVDEKEKSVYVNGWNEPELLLKIYHTIDRERDYVVCFLLANNITFYNPYHMHKAFRIPKTNKDVIWKSENVLFHWVSATLELKEDKKKCKFLKMIEDTEYGTYASAGEYIYDSNDFIMDRDGDSRYVFTLEYMGEKFGVWNNTKLGLIFIDSKFDPSCRLCYALTLNDHNENTVLTHARTNSLLKWLGRCFKIGRVKFTSMEVKIKMEDAIKLIL